MIIQASLKEWRLDDENSNIVGTIYKSINEKEYPEGERYVIMKVKCITFPPTEEFGPAHMIAITPIGNCFRLDIDELR
jgi:hypothetical protein